MPMLSNFELLTPLHPFLGKVKVLDPSDFSEVPVLPARASYEALAGKRGTSAKSEGFGTLTLPKLRIRGVRSPKLDS